MNKLAVLVAAAWLAGCVSAPDPRPLVYREGDRLLEQGVEAFADSNYPGAAALFRKALVRFQGVDDSAGVLRARMNLAEVAMALGRLDAVRDELRAARALLERSRADTYARRLRLLEAGLATREGDRRGAEKLLAPLLPGGGGEAPDVPPDRIALAALADRTRLAFEEDQASAEAWTTRLAHAIEKSGEAPLLRARLARFQAELARRQSHYGAADALLYSAHALYAAAAYRPGIAATLVEWAALAEEQGEREIARDRLKRALAIRLWILDRDGSLAVLEKLRTLNAALGADDRAQAAAQWMDRLRHRKLEQWPQLRDQIPAL